MLVSVMGAVFNMILAFALSCVLYFFGYDVSDSQLTTKVGYVADTVERWNPLVEEGEEVSGPAKKAGLLPGDEIVRVDGAPVENFMDIQNRIVTGKDRQRKKSTCCSLCYEIVEIDLDIYPEVSGPEEMRVIGIGPKKLFDWRTNSDMPAQKIGLEVGDQPVL